jgi:threonine/homoserine/homoserine lactone efflux protein
VLLALTPGPDMAVYLSRAYSGGRLHGYAALAGAISGVVVHTFAAGLGLSALIAASARAYDAVKIAGALYLVYLAWGALKHGAALKLEAAGGAAGTLRGAYTTGLLINLTNPKIILFFVTFLPQFIDAGDPDPSRKLFVLGFSFVVIGGLVSAAIIAVAGRFVAAARANPRAVRWFDYGFAGLMGAFAARLILGAAR